MEGTELCRTHAYRDNMCNNLASARFRPQSGGVIFYNVFYNGWPPGGAIKGCFGKSGAEVHVHPGNVGAIDQLVTDGRTDGQTHGVQNILFTMP